MSLQVVELPEAMIAGVNSNKEEFLSPVGQKGYDIINPLPTV